MFSFDTMWTPRIMTVVYIIGLVLILIFGLMGLLASLGAGPSPMNEMGRMGQMGPGGGPMMAGPVGAVVTILVTALFIVLWRMWCEIVLVMFKILERLGEVRDRLKP